MELTVVTNKSFSLFLVVHWAHNTTDDERYLSDNQDGQQNNLCLNQKEQVKTFF